MFKKIITKIGFSKEVVNTESFQIKVVKTPWSQSITVIDEPTGFVFVEDAIGKSEGFQEIRRCVIDAFVDMVTMGDIHYTDFEMEQKKNQVEREVSEIINNDIVTAFFAA